MKKAFLVLPVLGIIICGMNIYIHAEDNIHLEKGKELFKEKKYEQAIEEFKQGLRTNNKDDKKLLLAFIGSSCHFLQRYNEAVKYYEESLKIDAEYLYPIEMLGILYFGGLKDYEKGMEFNLKAEKFRSVNNMVYYNMACYYSLKNDKEKAIKYLDIVLYHNYRDIEYIKADTDFNNINSDRRFVNLVNNFQYIIEGDKYNKQGDQSYSKFNYDNSIISYQRAVQLYSKALRDSSIILGCLFNKIGLMYLQKQNAINALEFYTKALKIYLEILGNKHNDTAICYDNLGTAYLVLRDCDNSILYFEKVLVIYRENLGERNYFIGTKYNNIGLISLFSGDCDHAIEYFEKTLVIYMEVLGGKHPDIAKIYNNLGMAYCYKGDYDRAIVYHEKALAIDLKVFKEKHIDIAICYNNLGDVYCKKENYRRAIEYHEKALEIRLELLGNKHPEIAKNYTFLGVAYSGKGDYTHAIEYYEKALAIDLKENSVVVGMDYSNLGVVYIKKKDYDRAIEYFEKAIPMDIKVRGEKNQGIALDYNNIGMAYRGKRDYARAISYLEKAILINKRTGGNQEIIICSYDLGSTYLDATRYKDSYTSFLTGIETIEKVRKLNLSGGTDFTSRNINSFYYAVNACFLDKNMNSMFNISERMRAMGYLERLSLKAAIEAAGIDPEQGRKLLKLKDDIERLSSFRQKLISMEIYKMNEQQKKERDKQLEQASKELAQAETEFTKLDSKFMKNEKYKSLRDTSVVTVNEAQKLCGKNSAIVEYILPDKPDKYMKPYAIIITGSSIDSVELDSKYNFSEQIDRYRAAIRDNKQPDMDSLSAELYSKLIEPVNTYISSKDIKRLIIVPDGALAFLPFDSLKTKDNKFLSDKHELNLTPSVTVSAMTQNRKYDKRDNLMAFGGGLYSSTGETKAKGDRSFRGMAIEAKQKEKLAAKAYNTPLEYYNAQKQYWSDLPGTEKEVSAINDRIYHKKNSEVYTGSKVSEENLKLLSKQGKLKGYSSIHLACHGYYDPEYPAYSAVVFSEVSGKLEDSKDDGYMSVEETALLNLQSDIVVLSACETGLGKVVSGDGVIGLTRAFKVAGSNRVLVTLWPVSDEATEAFMVSFYKKVKAGMSYSQALVKVKEEFRNSSKGGAGIADYSAPYYWAGFVLYE